MASRKSTNLSRTPVLFLSAIIAPFAIMLGGVFLGLRYVWPHAKGYGLLNIVLGFVLAQFVVTGTLLGAGWRRGERPRWFVIIALVFSVASVWRIFFAGL